MDFFRNKLAIPKINKNRHFQSIIMRISNKLTRINLLISTDTVSNSNNNKIDKKSSTILFKHHKKDHIQIVTRKSIITKNILNKKQKTQINFNKELRVINNRQSFHQLIKWNNLNTLKIIM